jgi:RimJ/RimL family protein N-acetyltransferase
MGDADPARAQPRADAGGLSAFDDIETPRLLLRLVPADAVLAGAQGDLAGFERGLGLRVPPDLAARPAVLQFAAERLAEDPDYLPWSMRAIVLKDSATMVGHLRFHTRPDPEYLQPYAQRAVEFGYEVFAGHRRRGYAEEAARAGMRWAREVHGIGRFVLTVAPDNIASTALVRKLGFRHIGEHDDPVDGLELIYRLDTSPEDGGGRMI